MTEEILRGDRDGEREGIGTHLTRHGVELGDFSVTSETEIVFQHMPATGDDRAVILRISAAQIEIRAVLVGGIVSPLEAARVMIGVESVHFVAHRDASHDHVTGDRIRQLLHPPSGLAASFETVAVAERGEARRVTVVKRPAIS